ncbi:MAG: ABC transporter permease subunit [Clostridiales bacterium]|jgi:putative aldouronate transport system permease protein|nr:ABC transporter permease subunit [Clostridiales bacterium]
MATIGAAATTRKKPLLAQLKLDLPKYVILAPAIILLFMFNYMPIYGVLIAFKNFKAAKGILGSDWAGFHYFELFLRDPNFWRVMKNTLLINIGNLLFGFPFPIIFALVINELRSKKFVKFAQTVSYLPYFISWVVAASIIRSILSPSTGMVNNAIKFFGFEPIYFLSKSSFFQPLLIISGIWKGFGMSAVYYIAALAGIDQELYQAAAVDGAGKMRQAWHITLPGLRNIIIVLFVLQLGSIMSIGFDQVFLLYNPMLYETGDVISTYTYRLGFPDSGVPQYSLSSAVGFTQSLANFILVFNANRLAKKYAGWSLW